MIGKGRCRDGMNPLDSAKRLPRDQPTPFGVEGRRGQPKAPKTARMP